MPHSGTNTMYSPVINPAFPALSVKRIPYCWSEDAANKITPQSAPVPTFFFRSALLILFRSKISTTGINERTPTKNRIPLNQNAPKELPPMFWNAKANPQIKAVKNKTQIYLGWFSFIIVTILQPNIPYSIPSALFCQSAAFTFVDSYSLFANRLEIF